MTEVKVISVSKDSVAVQVGNDPWIHNLSKGDILQVPPMVVTED